jgi:uncharacterized protein (TIGR02001 family)
MVLSLGALSHAPQAVAQVAASASLQSDYRYRGRSLSDRQPTLSVDVAYDHPSGLYAGASAIAGRTEDHGVEMLGDIEYAGYAARPRKGPAWDVGVVRTSVTGFEPVKRTAEFSEVYAGVLTDHLSFRTYYADDYYELGFHTLYADVGAAVRPARNLRLFGHLGALVPVGSQGRGRRTRYDFSAGVAATAGPNEVRVTWTRASPTVIYPSGYRERGALVVGLKHFF